jgi:hypothetical protein
MCSKAGRREREDHTDDQTSPIYVTSCVPDDLIKSFSHDASEAQVAYACLSASFLDAKFLISQKWTPVF